MSTVSPGKGLLASPISTLDIYVTYVQKQIAAHMARHSLLYEALLRPLVGYFHSHNSAHVTGPVKVSRLKTGSTFDVLIKGYPCCEQIPLPSVLFKT